MADSKHQKPQLSHNHRRRHHHHHLGFKRALCCYFGISPRTPEEETLKPSSRTKTPKKSTNSISPNSPQTNRNALAKVSRIDPRRILSPGRVSPIDSDTHLCPLPEIGPETALIGDDDDDGADDEAEVIKEEEVEITNVVGGSCVGGVYDVRLSLKGKKNGECLVLELDSRVLCQNSEVFANLVSDFRKKSSGCSGGNNLCRIEVPDVENLGVYHETVALMFENDITRRLVKMGVSRSIDVLEVAASIKFTKGVSSCLQYLEAVPWTEGEEEKLNKLFTRYKFDDTTKGDVLSRLYTQEQINSQEHLAMQLVCSVTNGTDTNARSELKSFVKGLLSKSSIYQKNLPGLNQEDLYIVCESCLGSLVKLFEEACDSSTPDQEKEKSTRQKTAKPLIERISRQVDNLNWLLEILLEQHMAEGFVDVWADQGDLLRMHERVSPMVRYEISRISAAIFVALGRGKLHCRSETRCRVLEAWFEPMLVDFGWLQRCRKGLDVKVLEDSIGQALLTLPMKHQGQFFMEWLRCFSKQGRECPNLGKAFQTWWRRSSLRSSKNNGGPS